MVEQTKQRIEFIDLAKGLCILLVVSWHVDTNDLLYCNENIEKFFKAFRMPLYYVLSGIFLSIKGDYFMFFQKKINKIIVPFIFFVTITNVVFWIGKDLLGGYEKGWFAGEFQWMSPIIFCYEEFPLTFNNGPIWFLPCLFAAYMIYMLVDKISNNNFYTKLIFVLVISFGGFLLNKGGINIPFYINEAMCAIPYLLFGEFLRKRTGILVSNKLDKYNLLVSVFFFLILWLLVVYFGGVFLMPYVNGLIGTLGVLLFAKQFKHIPVISYIGRYSIVMLGIHGPMIGFFKSIFSRCISNLYISDSLVFLAIVCSVIIVTKLFVKYLPWFVAQKDIVFFSK